MKFSEKRLRGTCNVSENGKAVVEAQCYLNLEESSFHCFLPKSNHPSLDINSNYEITDVQIKTLFGDLYTQKLEVAFCSSLSSGSFSRNDSQLTDLLGITNTPVRLSFIINEPPIFRTNLETHQILLSPGIDTVSRLKIKENIICFGTSDYFSIFSNEALNSVDVKFAASLMIGAPCQKLAILEPGQCQIFLNNFNSKTKNRPIIKQSRNGETHISIDLRNQNLSNIFIAAFDYINQINATKKDSMIYATNSYLEVRIISSSYAVKLLAEFHFLEWFDESRTINPNQLVDKLNINRNEADGIKHIRDKLTHNSQQLSEVIKEGVQKITSEQHRYSEFFEKDVYDDAFMNYIYTLLGQELLNKIAYEGEIESYYPI